MAEYDMFGFEDSTLEQAAQFVRAALGIDLELRDSSFYAGNYYSYRPSYGHDLKLYNNYDAGAKQWVRGEYPQHNVILELNDLDDMPSVRRKLASGGPGRPILLRSSSS